MRAIGLALLSCGFCVSSGLAEVVAVTAAPATNSWTPDLANALNVILMAAATAIAGVITAVGLKLAKKLGFEATAQDKENLEAELRAALNVGITKLLPLIAAHGWNVPEVHDAILINAADYLRQRFPDRATQITAAAQPESSSDGPRVSSTIAITETLAARLPGVIKVAASSPATPPLPPDPVNRRLV